MESLLMENYRRSLFLNQVFVKTTQEFIAGSAEDQRLEIDAIPNGF